MKNVTQIIEQLNGGDPTASDRLLPMVYDALRKLATAKLAQEKLGQTLQPTALVHEAYLRLVGNVAVDQHWDGRHHFFAAAAEAMRRILVERARRRARQKHGGGFRRQSLDDWEPAVLNKPDELLAVAEALDLLEQSNPQAASLVKYRYFVGLTNAQAANLLGVSPRKANQIWAYARAWLRDVLESDP